jgi:hypothetical protein
MSAVLDATCVWVTPFVDVTSCLFVAFGQSWRTAGRLVKKTRALRRIVGGVTNV